MKPVWQKILIYSIIVIFVLSCGIVYLNFLKSKPEPKEQPATEPKEQPAAEEKAAEQKFSLMADISRIDKNKTLAVKPLNTEKEIIVIVNEDTKITKLEFPFDLNNPPQKEFSLTASNLTFAELKEGDRILIKSRKNIAGKDSFSNIELIEVLP